MFYTVTSSLMCESEMYLLTGIILNLNVSLACSKVGEAL